MGKLSFLRYIGIALVGISIYFIIGVFWENRIFISNWKPGITEISLFTACALIYGSSQFLLSGAWSQLLGLSNHDNINKHACHRMYGQSQIAKYIPGNIFHYAGRHTLGRLAGYSNAALISATFYETLCLLVTASTLSIAGIAVLGLGSFAFSQWQLITVFTLSVTILIAAAVTMPRLAKIIGSDLPINSFTEIVLRLKNVFLLYAIFFIVSGILLSIVVASQSSDLNLSSIGVIIIISIASWIAGFVTPGAPAGVGIREALIVLALTQVVDQSLAIVAALIYRLITVSGDIVFFFITRIFTLKH